MQNPFRYFNSSPEVIRLTVMMYIRYPLSVSVDLRSMRRKACRWKTLLMIFHSPSTLSSVNKSV